MRLLVVNPNTSTGVTRLIHAEAQRSCSPDTQLIMCTASHGFEYIETRFEALIAGSAVAEVIAEHPGVDGVVVAAFGDPGLPALKELTSTPIIGITEAALCAAALQGGAFSIIAISERITPWYRDCVRQFGLADRLVSIRSIHGELGDVTQIQHDHRATIARLATAAARQDGADSVILAGAPLAGLARGLKQAIPVPLIDGIAAGIRLTEAMVHLNPGNHREGAFAPPPPKPRRGLPTALNTVLDAGQRAHRDPDPEQRAVTPPTAGA